MLSVEVSTDLVRDKQVTTIFSVLLPIVTLSLYKTDTAEGAKDQIISTKTE